MKYSERRSGAKLADRLHFIVSHAFWPSGNITSYDNDFMMKICLYMNFIKAT